MQEMKPFNIPVSIPSEHVSKVIASKKFSGNGPYNDKCQQWFESHLGCEKALMTPSCTAALELAAMLIDIREGDEVIMPSYTFVSTANAFVLRGAKVIFVDVRPDTMNIDERLIEAAITEKTKAIVPVHYAGVGCDMDVIMDIAQKHGLYVIEDAAQGMMATYRERPLGTIGHLGCYSFHETKNYQCGEGGLLIINDKRFIERAEILREKGTNRSKFFRGEVDKYSWVDMGSSFLPSEFQAAYLYSQLEIAQEINTNRLASWQRYYDNFDELARRGHIELPTVSSMCRHNAHMFYIKLQNSTVRQQLIEYLKKRQIYSVFHYVPLHSSMAGEQYGVFSGVDRYTSVESDRLLRLPMYWGLETEDILDVVKGVEDFFAEGRL